MKDFFKALFGIPAVRSQDIAGCFLVKAVKQTKKLYCHGICKKHQPYIQKPHCKICKECRGVMREI